MCTILEIKFILKINCVFPRSKHFYSPIKRPHPISLSIPYNKRLNNIILILVYFDCYNETFRFGILYPNDNTNTYKSNQKRCTANGTTKCILLRPCFLILVEIF